jgi:hypothetical protein
MRCRLPSARDRLRTLGLPNAGQAGAFSRVQLARAKRLVALMVSAPLPALLSKWGRLTFRPSGKLYCHSCAPVAAEKAEKVEGALEAYLSSSTTMRVREASSPAAFVMEELEFGSTAAARAAPVRTSRMEMVVAADSWLRRARLPAAVSAGRERAKGRWKAL